MSKCEWCSYRPRHFIDYRKNSNRSDFRSTSQGFFITTGATDWFTGSEHLNSCLVSCSLVAEHSRDTNPANKFFETFVKYKLSGRICYRIHQIQPFKASDLFYVPTALTFRNSLFCPQCIYMFCVDLRTNRNTSLYRINLLVFRNKAESVYCAVRTGSLNQTDTA
jgi:hypothetical protein